MWEVMMLRNILLILFIIVALPLVVWSIVVLGGAIILRLTGNHGAAFLHLVLNEAPSGMTISFENHNVLGGILTILGFAAVIVGWRQLTRP